LLIENRIGAAGVCTSFFGYDSRRRQLAVDIGVAVGSEGNLLQVVCTLHSPGRFAGLLHGWKQKGDENANDGDRYEKLDEREGM
jgi:hypothetical protein